MKMSVVFKSDHKNIKRNFIKLTRHGACEENMLM